MYPNCNVEDEYFVNGNEISIVLMFSNVKVVWGTILYFNQFSMGKRVVKCFGIKELDSYACVSLLNLKVSLCFLYDGFDILKMSGWVPKFVSVDRLDVC